MIRGWPGRLRVMLPAAAAVVLAGCEVLGLDSGCGSARWTPLGPEGVGVLALEATPYGVWAGTLAHGVLGLRQDGEWEPLGLDRAPVSSLLAIDGRVLAGTDWPEPLFATGDAGRTWEPSWGGFDRSVRRMARDPDDPLRVIRAASALPEAESLDGGRTWDTLPVPTIMSSAYGMVVLSGDRIVTAGMGSFFNAYLTYYEKGEATIPRPIPWPDDMVNSLFGGLAQDPADPETLYAGDLYGLYVSRNGGRYWEEVLQGGWEVGGVPFGMVVDGGHLFIAVLLPGRDRPDSEYSSRMRFYRYRPGVGMCSLNTPAEAAGAESILRMGPGQFLVGTRGSGVWRVTVR